MVELIFGVKGDRGLGNLIIYEMFGIEFRGLDFRAVFVEEVRVLFRFLL